MPSVYPNSVPESILTRSFSFRGVVRRLCPGRRRVSWGWMSSSLSSLSARHGYVPQARDRVVPRGFGCLVDSAYIHGGTPSIIAPTPLQCDSPKVVTRKIVPNVLPAIVSTTEIVSQNELVFFRIRSAQDAPILRCYHVNHVITSTCLC